VDEAPAPIPAAEKEEEEVASYWLPEKSKKAKAKKALPVEW
jgi:hypothetical protein